MCKVEGHVLILRKLGFRWGYGQIDFSMVVYKGLYVH